MESPDGETPTKPRSSGGSMKIKRQSSHKSSTKTKKKEIKKDSSDGADEKKFCMKNMIVTSYGKVASEPYSPLLCSRTNRRS
ncbi:hypothetical protein RRG08_031398 [Elysia crispata]|uniref:Uncharacterized protein n=1 Tax=Elysia crispata TaxID=231223 RepID=A0AAE0ZMX6_9GAST|nr:hypothetical protein RRG08_031398 [Elysia crispata]